MSEKYRVIEILNKNELLINYGFNNGARIGNKVIISDKGEEVIDPVTKKSLGTLDIVKGKLEIYSVYPNFSICRDISREKRNLAMPFGVESSTVLRTNPLNVSEDDISGRWPKPIPPIKVGDEVQV